MINGEEKTYKRGYTQAEYTPWLSHMMGKQEQPILGDYVSDYMNLNTTRSALHIPESAPAWNMCSDTLEYSLQNEASLWIYNVLQKSGIKMMFYSGDTDGAIPTYGSKQWIAKLDREVTEAWRPWYTNGQVSGFVEKYEGLEFVTVKGVGHMAPQWARQPVTDMITAFIHGEPF